MSEFGWTRLAYLSVILAVLAILVKLGTFGVASFPESLSESVFAFNQSERASEEQYRVEEPAETRDEHPEKHSEDERAKEERADGHDKGKERGHSHEPVESIYENVNFEEDAPVFYRPAPRAAPRVGGASTEPSSASPGAKSCQTVGDAPPGSEILFPMTREHFDSYDDTWGAARPQGGHEGTDLMVPTGTPLLAMTDGRIVPVSGANGNGWNTLGGYTVMLEAAYSVGPVKEGDLLYYAHMDEKSDLRIGDTVEAGDVVGYAGDTGQGPEVSRGQFPPHLHLGWYETSGERTQLASGAMNPYPLLEWVKANGGSIEGGSDIPYCEAPQPSAPTPSGGGYWQFPSDPGVRPDMSTETDNAAPSPTVEQNASAEFSPDIPREKRRPERPNRSADPAPPREGDSPGKPPSEPNTPEPPSNGAPNRPPSFPDVPNPLPGIRDEIGEIIDGVLNPRPPKPTGEKETTEPPTSPAPPPKETTEADNPASPPGETPPEVTNPGDAPPEDTAPEEDAGCEPRDRDSEAEGEEATRELRDRGGEKDCAEDAEEEAEDSGSDEEPPPNDEAANEEFVEETTGPVPPEAVGDQYEGEQPNPEAGAEGIEPETTSGP